MAASSGTYFDRSGCSNAFWSRNRLGRCPFCGREREMTPRKLGVEGVQGCGATFRCAGERFSCWDDHRVRQVEGFAQARRPTAPNH